MRNLLLALCLSLSLIEASSAAVYRWTGDDGRTYYGDQPPLGARDVQTVGQRPGIAPTTATPDAAQAESTAREAECARLRADLNRYRVATKLVETDSLGRERVFTPEEQKLLVAKTEAGVTLTCGSSPTSRTDTSPRPPEPAAEPTFPDLDSDAP